MAEHESKSAVPAPPPGPTRIGDLPGLDTLRAIAVLLVMVFHGPAVSPMNYSSVLERWSRGCWVGVDLFFVLSGFLVTGTLLKGRGQEPLRSFWIRRALRILPLYYVYLGVLIVVQANRTELGLKPWVVDLTPDDFTMFALLLGNVPETFVRYPGLAPGVLWSIAIEEHFYLLWPLAVRGLSLRGLERLCLVIVVISPALRFAFLPAFGQSGIYHFTPFRLDGLAAGAWLAVQVTSPARWARIQSIAKQWAAVALATLVALIATPFAIWPPGRSGPYFATFAYSVIALSCGVFVVVATNPEGLLRRLCNSRVFALIGRVSYGMYIWHILVGVMLVRALRPFELPRTGLELLVPFWILLTLGVAWVSYRLLERPIRSLKSRLAPSVGMLELPRS